MAAVAGTEDFALQDMTREIDRQVLERMLARWLARAHREKLHVRPDSRRDRTPACFLPCVLLRVSGILREQLGRGEFMREAGVTAEPQVAFWEELDTPDKF